MAESNHKPFSPEEFENIFSKVPRLCVDLVIRKDDGIILTLRTLPTWNNMWHTPGSMVLYRESIMDAIARVAKEEIGAEVNVVKFLDYMEFFSELEQRGYGYSVSMAFLCDYTGGDLKPNGDAEEIRVFRELPENMIEEQHQMLKKHWAEITAGR
jgi:ADP-ribose pyrophosphatase YjhB (NUDIX family)